MAVEEQPGLPLAAHPETLEQRDMDDKRIVQILNGYLQEAEEARRGGASNRDTIWQQNVDLYWNNWDYSDKAGWQSKEAMPEAPVFVDRWASAMREALVASGEWFTVTDPTDKESDLAQAIKRFMKIWLARAGRSATGQAVGFEATFEHLMKLAAMMAATASVTWKTDADGRGFVAVEPVDPREVWLDGTGRGLYRVRRIEIDRHRLKDMAKLKDAQGKPLFNQEAIERLDAQHMRDMLMERERLAGHGVESTTPRKPIVIHEYLCTLIDDLGNKVADNVLVVVANKEHIIRGPEKNPFWHRHDWIVYAPAISVPMSVYGRSYMENWASVARTFVDLTNLILDAVFLSSVKAFAVVPDMLEDPTELEDGVFPGKTFQLEAGSDPKQFLHDVDMGTVPNSSITIWQALKQELREGAAFNEIALGQSPPKGDITATEVAETQQSSMAMLKSIAVTIETLFLDPLLDLVWKTALQHMQPDDEELQEAIGPEMFQMFLAQRQALASRRITFKASGISSLLARAQKLRSLMSVMQTLGGNPVFAQILFSQVDPTKLVDEILRLSGVDVSTLQASPRDQKIAQITGMMQQLMGGEQQGSPPRQPGQSQPGGV